MPNPYFKFKQFTIHQDKCAMKVCTDACLFGAFVAAQNLAGKHCLDVGTGTGLLSLMVAQQNESVHIDAVEIDPDAAAQARENITNSPWGPAIRVVIEDITNYKPDKIYDCIFSNPPFYENDLVSPDESKNKAKHSSTLNLQQLIAFVNVSLTPGGFFAVLLPYHRLDLLREEAAKSNLFLSAQILVKQTPKHAFFRGIQFYARQQRNPELSELIIKDNQNNYTPEFIEKLKAYYLFL